MTTLPSPPTSESFQNGIRRRLYDGKPAQALLKEVVDYITLNKPCDPGDMSQLIARLADHGACVATDEPGCAFDRLISTPYRARPAMFTEVFYRLMGRPGELPFHIMARHGHLQMSDEMLSNPDLLPSMRARDSHGRTVSHWLWSEGSHLAEQAAAILTEQPGGDADRAHGWWLASVRQSWVLQQQLQELGVGLEIPDHNGVTALELCASRVDDGSAVLIEEFDLCRLVEVYRVSRDMQGKTTTPSGTPPPAPGMRF